MNTFIIHFDNGETVECRIRLSLSDLIGVLNDQRNFVAVEDKFGNTQVISKQKIQYVTTKEYL